jgi:hypothetical protein
LQGAYAFFLLFIFINNYVILPTFVASIISSYLEANLKEHSLVSKQELIDFRGTSSVGGGWNFVCLCVYYENQLLSFSCLALEKSALVSAVLFVARQTHWLPEQQLPYVIVFVVAYLSNLVENRRLRHVLEIDACDM